ncbi:hypothetical protein ASE51_17645 [Bacillus sp. Root147]|nr:hypothetical protein ASE51_17645 [Bacillus sp. Root147]
MIFVTLGTQKFQLNRLLKEIDKLVGNGEIEQSISSQVGHSDYSPQNFSVKKFLNEEQFNNCIANADIVIAHGGTSSIVKSLKLNKKTIVVPRRSEYGEHVDNHQEEIVGYFENIGSILVVRDIESLNSAIKKCELWNPNFIDWSKQNNLIGDIKHYIYNA